MNEKVNTSAMSGKVPLGDLPFTFCSKKPPQIKQLALNLSAEINRLSDDSLNTKQRIERFISFFETIGEDIVQKIEHHSIWDKLIEMASSNQALCSLPQQREPNKSGLNQLLGIYYNSVGMIALHENKIGEALTNFGKSIARGSTQGALNKYRVLKKIICIEGAYIENKDFFKENISVLLKELETLATGNSPAAAFIIVESTYLIQNLIAKNITSLPRDKAREDLDFVKEETITRLLQYASLSLTIAEKIKEEAKEEAKETMPPSRIKIEMENLFYGKGKLEPERNGIPKRLIFEQIPHVKGEITLVNILKAYKTQAIASYKMFFPPERTRHLLIDMIIDGINKRGEAEALSMLKRHADAVTDNTSQLIKTGELRECIEAVLMKLCKSNSKSIGTLAHNYDSWEKLAELNAKTQKSPPAFIR
jgi:hypothetical protein